MADRARKPYLATDGAGTTEVDQTGFDSRELTVNQEGETRTGDLRVRTGRDTSATVSLCESRYAGRWSIYRVTDFCLSATPVGR